MSETLFSKWNNRKLGQLYRNEIGTRCTFCHRLETPQAIAGTTTIQYFCQANGIFYFRWSELLLMSQHFGQESIHH